MTSESPTPPVLPPKPERLSFPAAVRKCLRRYASFSGRARRSEYWWFSLFGGVVYLPFAFESEGLIRIPDGVSAIFGLAFLGLLVPTLAVLIRRLHDTGRSGWWWLIGLVPLVGWLILLVFLTTAGDSGPNAYGDPPRESPPDTTTTDSEVGATSGVSARGMWANIAVLSVFGISVLVLVFGLAAVPVTPAERALAGLTDNLVANGVSPSSAQCVADGMREGGYVDDLSADFEQMNFSVSSGLAVSPETQRFLEGLFHYMYDPSQGCLSPAEIAHIEATGPSPANDPRILSVVNQLTAECSEGSMAGCDMLWYMSVAGSDAEALAESCGGQFAPLNFEVTSCVSRTQDSAAFDGLVDDCNAGFFVACDALFRLTTVGSVEESLALTCGGKRESAEVGQVPCSVAYGLGARG